MIKLTYDESKKYLGLINVQIIYTGPRYFSFWKYVIYYTYEKEYIILYRNIFYVDDDGAVWIRLAQKWYCT